MNNEKYILENYKELKESIEAFMYILKENGFELDEDGNLIDSKTKKLVLGENDE